MVTKQNIIIGMVVLLCGFIISWFMFGQTGRKSSIQNPGTARPTIHPESDCCSKDQKTHGFECKPNCPPTMTANEVYIVGYHCLSPDAVEERNRYGCPK